MAQGDEYRQFVEGGLFAIRPPYSELERLLGRRALSPFLLQDSTK
jgi:hypothetical protein